MADQVPENERRARYTAIAGQTEFDITFPLIIQLDSNGNPHIPLEAFVNGSPVTAYTVNTTSLKLTFSTPMVGGEIVVLEGALLIKRGTGYPLGGSLKSSLLNGDFNLTIQILQELKRDSDRSLRLNLSDSSGISGYLPILTAGRVLAWGDNGLENGPLIGEISEAADNAQIALDAAAQAQASETNAGGYASSAAASLTAVQAIVDGATFKDTVYLSATDSPYTPTMTQLRGKMFAIDTSGLAPGGSFIFQFPTIAGFVPPVVVGIKKTTGDTNSITVLPFLGEKIDNQNSYLIQNIGGAVFLPDTDPTPDSWLSTAFGATLGDVVPFLLKDGISFTAGTGTTANTGYPGKILNLVVDREVFDQEDYTHDPNTGAITFLKPIPYGTKSISGMVISLLAIGQTGSNTVGWLQIATSLIGSAADLAANVANKFPTVQAVVSYVATALGIFSNGAKARAVAGQVVTTQARVNFAGVDDFDDNNWHDPVTNNARHTVDFNGRVNLVADLSGTTSAAGNVYTAFFKNGSSISVAKINYINGTSPGIGVSHSIDVTCAVGDYFEVFCTATGMTYTIDALSTFSARRIK